MVPITSYALERARRLDHAALGRFEVLNAGVVGCSSSHGLRQLMVRILDLDPDILTVRFGVNDTLPSWAPWYRAHEPASPTLRALLYGSADWKLTRLGLDAYHAARFLHPAPESVRWTSLKRFRLNLERMIEVAHARGIRILLLDYPIVDSRAASHGGVSRDTLSDVLAGLHAVTRGVSRRMDAPFLATGERFTSHTEPLFDASDAVHPNPRGAAGRAQRAILAVTEIYRDSVLRTLIVPRLRYVVPLLESLEDPGFIGNVHIARLPAFPLQYALVNHELSALACIPGSPAFAEEEPLGQAASFALDLAFDVLLRSSPCYAPVLPDVTFLDLRGMPDPHDRPLANSTEFSLDRDKTLAF